MRNELSIEGNSEEVNVVRELAVYGGSEDLAIAEQRSDAKAKTMA
jgi:hypothetical protein